MIQVQIASQLTRRGVSGLRWVLVENGDAAAAPAPAPAQRLADAAESAAQAPGNNARATVSLTLLRAATLALGLVAAGWSASLVLGKARSTGSAPPPASARPLPAAASPPPSASQTPAAAPLLTAGPP